MDYYLRDIPPELRQAVQTKLDTEGRSLKWVLLRALRDYVAGLWRPATADALPAPKRARR